MNRRFSFACQPALFKLPFAAHRALAQHRQSLLLRLGSIDKISILVFRDLEETAAMETGRLRCLLLGAKWSIEAHTRQSRCRDINNTELMRTAGTAQTGYRTNDPNIDRRVHSEPRCRRLCIECGSLRYETPGTGCALAMKPLAPSHLAMQTFHRCSILISLIAHFMSHRFACMCCAHDGALASEL